MSQLFSSLVASLHDTNPWILLLVLLIPFLVTLAVVPVVLVRLPSDYFVRKRRQPLLLGARHPLLRLLVRVLMNLLGVAVILMGIAMLVLPGQGVLTMLLGFLLLEFPGKFRAERWVISRAPVLGAVNWLRAKWGRAPIEILRE